MKRIPLQDRIAGIHGGAVINDVDYAIECLRTIYAAPMRTLIPREHYRSQMAQKLGKEPEEIADMKIVKIANLIEELWAVTTTHEQGAYAARVLAAPYLWEARKRDRG